MLSPIRLPIKKLEEMGFTNDEAIALQQTISLLQDISQIGMGTTFHTTMGNISRTKPLLHKLSEMARRLNE